MWYQLEALEAFDTYKEGIVLSVSKLIRSNVNRSSCPQIYNFRVTRIVAWRAARYELNRPVLRT